MMREILFRAKRSFPCEWVYGYYSALPDCAGVAYMITSPAENPDESNRTFFIDPSTVGQFTGRLDKNGKRVFAGDILDLLDAKFRGVVIWSNHDQCYIISPNGDENLHLDDFGNYGNAEYFQIIGNIYDNPELL